MTSKLPLLSGEELIRIMQRVGYVVDHQTGSHIILRHKTMPHARLTIPRHQELAKGTLRAIIRQAGMSKEEFMLLFRL